jgi:hypothetical protein
MGLCDFLALPFVEIEIRLGTILRDKFDANIDKKYFEKIKESLEQSNWESVVCKNTVEYIEKSERGSSIKYVSDITGKETKEIILKENVLTEDHQLSFSPFDIRYSVNQEFNLKSQHFLKNEDSFIRNKVRTSFISKNFKYDLTLVNENNEGVLRTKYEIEIELLVSEETLNWETGYLNDFLECKVYDLVNIVEPMERSKFKINWIKK